MFDPINLPVVPIAHAQRPKRGHRRKRPELNDEQRRALRALQNRQATRRSRERMRAKAEELKTRLQRSEIQREALREERDRLLARVDAQEDHTSDSSRCRRNPMSLSVILNHDDNEHDYFFTPPLKRSRNVL